jgi:hypothetical protein
MVQLTDLMADSCIKFEPKDREPMKIPEISANAKEGSYPCKKHSNAGEYPHIAINAAVHDITYRVLPMFQLEEATHETPQEEIRIERDIPCIPMIV